jgi:hypothetical protein
VLMNIVSNAMIAAGAVTILLIGLALARGEK